MANIDYELENQLALQKMKEAQALRKSDISPQGTFKGRMYMADYAPMSNGILDRLSGNKMEDDSIVRQRELAAQQDTEVQSYVDKIRNPPKVLTKSLRQGEGPLMEPNIDDTQRDMTPVEANQYQMNTSMDAMRLPKAKAMATQFVNSGVGFPEKWATLEAQREATKEATATRLQQARELQQQRIDNQNMNNRLFKLTAEQQMQNATMKGQPKPTAAEAKSIAGGKAAIGNIDAAISLIDENPDALGVSNYIPGSDTIRQYTDTPGEIKTRASVADIGSLKLHDRSGAAVTISEWPRLAPFIPKATDSAEAAKIKLQNLKEAYEREMRSWGHGDGAAVEPTVNPTTPTNFPRVTAATQQSRDSDRLVLLRQELAANPDNANTPVLKAEIAKEEAKMVKGDPFVPARGDPPKPASVSAGGPNMAKYADPAKEARYQAWKASQK